MWLTVAERSELPLRVDNFLCLFHTSFSYCKQVASCLIFQIIDTNFHKKFDTDSRSASLVTETIDYFVCLWYIFQVTTVHKANIMKLSDGLFLETSRSLAKEYPEIEHNDMIIDNCCMQLVAK